VTDLLVQAESRGPSAFSSLHLDLLPADSERVRGPSHQNAAPCEHVAVARKQSASSVPLILRGVTGHRPVRRGSARRAAASAQGKAFPNRIRHTALG
jgi:hypothetical protein